MARDLSSLPVLNTADELLAFLREDPNDRFIRCGSDLDPTESPDGLRNRSDDLFETPGLMKTDPAALGFLAGCAPPRDCLH